ncbi:MAG: hypothetical protein AMXMBFR33_65570 [Candidatus Xenobia bacterium]
MRSWFLRLGREAAAYGLGKVLIGSFYLLLIPAYTRLLAPEQYGRIETLVQLQALLTCFMVLGADTALSYHFYQVEGENPESLRRLVSARVQLLLGVGTSLAAAAFTVGWLAGLELVPLGLALLGLLCQLLMSGSVDLDRLRHRPAVSVGVNLLYVVVAGLTSLGAMLGLGWSVEAFFLGQVVGGLVAASIGWFGNRALLELGRLHREEARRLLRTGLPLVPAAVALYTLANGEKWLISYFMGASALGLYAVAYRLASVISFWMESFRQAFWPLAMEAINREQGPGLFRNIAQLYLLLSCAAVLLLAGLGPYAVEVLVGAKFREAYPLLGILGWPVVLSGLFNVITPGFWKSQRSNLIPVTAGASAVLSLSLNAALIPHWGLAGVAAAVVTSYTVWNFASLFLSERLWPVGFPWLRMLAIVLAGVGATLGLTWLVVHGQVVPVAGVLAGCLLLVGLASRRPLRTVLRG